MSADNCGHCGTDSEELHGAAESLACLVDEQDPEVY